MILLLGLVLFSSPVWGEEGPYLEADLMIVEEETEIITCEGNVHFFDHDLQIVGDYATFKMQDLSYFFSGAVQMNFQELELTSQELEGNLDTEDLLAQGVVQITHPQYFMTGDLFQLLNLEQRAFMEGNAFMTGEAGEMSGDRMDWDLDFTHLEITGAAKWEIPEATGSAERILYQEEEGLVTFTGEARVFLSQQNFYGEEIFYSFKEGRVRIIKGGIQFPPRERD